MRMRLPLRIPSLNMRPPGMEGYSKSRGDRFRRRVGRDAVAEGPVFLCDLDQVDPGILAPQAERREVVRDAPEEGSFLLQAAADADRDLHDDDVVGASDAEKAGVVDQVAGLMLGEHLEAVGGRDVDRIHERAMNGVAKLAAICGCLALDERNAHERHGWPLTCC